jgi:hypothetical protein
MKYALWLKVLSHRARNAPAPPIEFQSNFRLTLLFHDSGNVRGELVIGGFILKPLPDGTQCQYIVQSDLKGTIPGSIVNMVSSNQPMVLANIKKTLETGNAGGYYFYYLLIKN